MKPVFRGLRALAIVCLSMCSCVNAQPGMSTSLSVTAIDQYDSVFFDLSQAACISTLAQFPVFIKTDDPVYALDFSLKFDVTKMAYHSIVIHQGYLMASANYNSADSTLRFTSSSMTPIGNLVSLVSVRFTMLNGGQINDSDLNPKSSLLNGTSCSRRIVHGALQPVLNPAGVLIIDPGDSITLSVSAPVNSSFLWSTSTTANSIVVYAAGNYSVTVTTQAGCNINLSASIQYTSPLPVQLLVFSLKMISGNVLVQWITVSEVNNDFFTVERSADGIHFEDIGIVDGEGNSTQLLTYQLLDDKPLSGISFYRLKQTDFDGKFTYSQTVSISNVNVTDETFTLFPNPANQYINIRGNNFSEESLEVGLYKAELMDMSGKVMKSIQVTGIEQQMDVSQLPAGICFMRILPAAPGNDSKMFLQRVVVMH